MRMLYVVLICGVGNQGADDMCLCYANRRMNITLLSLKYTSSTALAALILDQIKHKHKQI